MILEVLPLGVGVNDLPRHYREVRARLSTPPKVVGEAPSSPLVIEPIGLDAPLPLKIATAIARAIELGRWCPPGGKRSHAVLVAVACTFGVARSDILSASTKKRVYEARQIAMTVLRELLGLGWEAIGRDLRKDRTSAVHAWEKYHDIVAPLVAEAKGRSQQCHG